MPAPLNEVRVCSILEQLQAIPYSLFPIPYSLFPIPYSLFPVPYSLQFPRRVSIRPPFP